MKSYLYKMAGLLVMAACQSKDPQADAEEQLTAFEEGRICITAQVEMRDIDDVLILNGDVMYDETLLRNVFVPCTGRVSELHVEVGDQVSRGQLLATIHSEEAANYRKGIMDADAEIRLAERAYQMQVDLNKCGIASNKDVEEARLRMQIAKAEQQRLGDVATIHGYKQNADASIVAPISGYVIAKRIYNDTYVNDDNRQEAALEIADLKRVWVVADVYESDIAKVRQGAVVSVTTLAYPDETFRGQIDRIYPLLDQESQTMKIRVCLDNPRGVLKPGMFASVKVSLSANGQQMQAVPSEAVLFEHGKDYVMVEKEPDQYARTEVHVAYTANGYSYISSGLKTGEKVVTKNALLYFNADRNE